MRLCRLRVEAFRDGEVVFCSTMTVLCGMLKSDDDDVIGGDDHDVLHLSWMMPHDAHALHVVCLRRYCAFVVDASDLVSVFALCAEWTRCLLCP